MLVLALLPPELLLPFRLALSRRDRLVSAANAEELRALVLEQAPDVLVVDPMADPRIAGMLDGARPVGMAPVEGPHAVIGQFPIIVYTTPAPETMHAAFNLARYGAKHIVLRGYDDTSRHVRSTLVQAQGEALCERVWEGIQPRFATAPEWLLAAMQRVFQAPLEFRGVKNITGVSSHPRRSLDYWLSRLELAPARTFWTAARVAWAYPAIRARGMLLKRVAERLGYSKPEYFARHVRHITGLTPKQLRAVEPEALLRLIVHRLAHARRSRPRPHVARDRSGAPPARKRGPRD
ncbi:MAG TPA: helix-turn-helix domain-containing protein [Gemmatimonadaceae bacterium]|nr:helix-turn-helix domain-containing protein [Gemmatimonadaceae bacterium]